MLDRRLGAEIAASINGDTEIAAYFNGDTEISSSFIGDSEIAASDGRLIFTPAVPKLMTVP